MVRKHYSRVSSLPERDQNSVALSIEKAKGLTVIGTLRAVVSCY
jgi:hypothetical protein